MTKNYKDWKPYVWKSPQAGEKDDKPVVNEDNEWRIELEEDDDEEDATISTKKEEEKGAAVFQIGEGSRFAYHPKTQFSADDGPTVEDTTMSLD